jgi:hypothetical protein
VDTLNKTLVKPNMHACMHGAPSKKLRSITNKPNTCHVWAVAGLSSDDIYIYIYIHNNDT